MQEYQEFLNKYFPLSGNISEENRIYNLICENNIMSSLFLKYSNDNLYFLNEEKYMYYARFRDGINKLLIYLPLNEGIGIYACMRYSVEQFLKFVYGIYFDYNIDKINRTSYRHIKDDIRDNSNIAQPIKDELLKLYTYYAKYSNDIHDKNLLYEDELIFLGNILKNENSFAQDIDKDVSNILIITYNILIRIFDITFQCFSASERLQLAKLELKKRKNKILKILQCNIN